MKAVFKFILALFILACWCVTAYAMGWAIMAYIPQPYSRIVLIASFVVFLTREKK